MLGCKRNKEPDDCRSLCKPTKPGLAAFLAQEARERVRIAQTTKAFEKAIDDQKKDKLRMIEERSSLQKAELNAKVEKLESALDNDDPEKIKDALKCLSIFSADK